MHIVVLGWPTVSNGDISAEIFGGLGSYECYDVLDEEGLCGVVKNADAILLNRVTITAKVMDSAPNLKYIGLLATGYNNVDIDAARKKGITVTNIPGYSTDAVATHTMGFILALALSLVKYNDHVKNGGWSFDSGCDCFPFKIQELEGKTLGLFGFGNIAQRVAKMARIFGMRVIYYSRTPKNFEGATQVDFETLLKESDFLSLHAPLTPETQNTFDAKAFSKMKPTAYFINTARGGIVDEPALAEALNKGIIAGAAVDVTANEPLTESSPLFGAKNCIYTPHVAWGAYETRQRLINLAYENLKSFCDGQPINVVNK